MSITLLTTLQLVNLLVLPLLLSGLIRKSKALMQNRLGPPLLQPFFDLAKQLRKTQTISSTASWIFTLAPQVSLALTLCVAVLAPWNGPLLPLSWSLASNFILLLYLLALGKFLSLLAALDTGSAFGGLGASREATLSVMVEPTLVLAFSALALGAGSTDLQTIFTSPFSPWLAAFAGCSLLLAALAELSRMPVDDPTTHLELTMIHEAMVLEYSGSSLGAIEYCVALRSCIYLGLALQVLLHVWPAYSSLTTLSTYAVGTAGLLMLGVALAIAEGLLVKVRWRKIPSFLAYAAAMGLLATLIAAVGL